MPANNNYGYCFINFFYILLTKQQITLRKRNIAFYSGEFYNMATFI